MTYKKDERKKYVLDHVTTLEKGVKDIQKSKAAIKISIKEGKKSLENMENTEREMTKQITLLKSINSDKANELDENTWNNYLYQYDNDKNFCASLSEFKGVLIKVKPFDWAAFSGTSALRMSSSTHTLYNTFENTPVETEEFRSTVTQYKIEIHPTKSYQFIRLQLSKIDKSISDSFHKIVGDLLAAEQDIKYKYLLDLRSLIFDQLFEAYSPQSQYVKTHWFKVTAAKTPEKSKRFCQPKYFMLGNTDYNSLNLSLQKRVNDLSYDMVKNFNNLSNYGKYGTKDKQATIVFNQTTTTFSEILSLRDSLHTVR